MFRSATIQGTARCNPLFFQSLISCKCLPLAQPHWQQREGSPSCSAGQLPGLRAETGGEADRRLTSPSGLPGAGGFLGPGTFHPPAGPVPGNPAWLVTLDLEEQRLWHRSSLTNHNISIFLANMSTLFIMESRESVCVSVRACAHVCECASAFTTGVVN